MSDLKEGQSFRIGELLVKEGYLTLDALNKVLDIQKEQKFISKSKKAYKPFGQICIELDLISQAELQRFLKKYNMRIFLGELLINMGLINRQQLDHALEQQRVAQAGEKCVDERHQVARRHRNRRHPLDRA